MKRVQVSLTVPQALALNNLVAEGLTGYEDNRAVTVTMSRAVCQLEDAIEKVRGEFANRYTERAIVNATTAQGVEK